MEIKPNKINKYNKPIFGLILGMILPFISFMIYYLYLSTKKSGLDFSNLIYTMTSNQALIPILSLCVLPNLILYFIFKKLDYWYAIKGVVTSVLIYTLTVFVIKII